MHRAKVVFIIVILLALSCSKNSVDDENQTQPVSGIVDGWQNGGFLNKLDIGVYANSNFLRLDSTTIENDGNFSVNYPFPNPPDSVLRSYIPNRDSNQYVGNFDNIVFSNFNARYVPLGFCIYESHHQMRMSLFPSNRYVLNDSTSMVGDYFIQYYYFNQPTTISGSYRTSFYVPPSSLNSKFNTSITNCNLNLSAGWNRIVTHIEQIYDSTVVYTVTKDDSGNPCWFPSWFDSRNFEHVLHW